MSELAVLLRNCPHNNVATGYQWSTTNPVNIRYALKCDSFSIQIAKTPIQVPIPQQAPEIIDIGFYRPSISIGGIVDTVGQDTTNTTAGFQNMESIVVSRKYWSSDYTNPTDYVNINQTYYIPYKNALEDAVYTWITTSTDELELEIGDANYPRYNTAAEWTPADPSLTPFLASGTNSETGGGVYVVAIQQCRFQVDPAQEDRWQFQMQLVCESRKDVIF